MAIELAAVAPEAIGKDPALKTHDGSGETSCMVYAVGRQVAPMGMQRVESAVL